MGRFKPQKEHIMGGRMSPMYHREYYLKNKERILARQKAYTRTVHAKNLYYKRQFGISYDEYLLLLASQGWICAACFHEETAVGRGGEVQHLSVHHNHRTGEVVALLCRACNVAEGHFRTYEQSLRFAEFMRRVR